MTNQTLPKLIQSSFYVPPYARKKIQEQREAGVTDTIVISQDNDALRAGTFTSPEAMAKLRAKIQKNPDEAKHYCFLNVGEQLDMPKLVPHLGPMKSKFLIEYALIMKANGTDYDPAMTLPPSVYYDNLDTLLMDKDEPTNPFQEMFINAVMELINDHLIADYALEAYELNVTFTMMRRPTKQTHSQLVEDFKGYLTSKGHSDVVVHSLKRKV